MQIIDNKAVVFKTRNPGKYSVIPKSRVVGEVENGIYEVAVYWGLDEARVLRNLGVKKIPSPIVARYDWPGRYKPFSHQVETASFLTLHRRAFVFNDPGTGKTMSALWAIKPWALTIFPMLLVINPLYPSASSENISSFRVLSCFSIGFSRTCLSIFSQPS